MFSSRPPMFCCSWSLRLARPRLSKRAASTSAFDPLFEREPLPHPPTPIPKSTPPSSRPPRVPRPSLSLGRPTLTGPSAPGQTYTPPTVVKALQNKYPQWVGNPKPAPKPTPPPTVASPDKPASQIASRKFTAEDALPWEEWERTRTEELQTKIRAIEAPDWEAKGLEKGGNEIEREEMKGKMRHKALDAARKSFGRRRRDALARRELMRKREEEAERRRASVL